MAPGTPAPAARGGHCGSDGRPPRSPTSPPLAYSMTKQRRSWVWKEYFRACEGHRAGIAAVQLGRDVMLLPHRPGSEDQQRGVGGKSDLRKQLEAGKFRELGGPPGQGSGQQLRSPQ